MRFLFSNRSFTKYFFVFFLSVIMFVFPVYALNTTYYVDSISGNDNNNGTSESSAWQSLSKVNSQTFEPGDQIFLKAGSSWSEQLLPNGSGSSSAPIILTKYGTGADPIIDGSGAAYTIRLDNQEYWEISNIEVMNTATTDALRIGLYLTAADAGTLDHIYIRNVYFHDIRSKAPNYAPGSHDSAGSFTGGIVGRIFGSTTPTRFNDVRIENCTFINTDRNMFYFFDSPWYNDSGLGMSGGAGAMFNSTNVIVRNNYAQDIPGTGTCLCSCDGAIVEYNVLDNCQSNVPSNVAGVAASTWSSQDCIYQYNEVMNTHGTADGQSFDNDGACRRCIFQYNYSHDNNGGFFLVCSLSSCKVYDAVCRYNISQNDRSGIFDHRAASYNSLIYNNTIYIASGLTVPMFRTDTDSKSGTASFYNNIFYNLGGNMGTGYNPYGGFTWSNNVYYGNFYSVPSDGSKLTSDPKLVNPGSGGNGRSTVEGYQLQSTSPCINSGISIANNGGFDYWGNSLYNGSPDRGAHEYQGDPTPGDITVIDQSGFSVVYVDSEELSGEDGAAENFVDGDTSTIWHTEWYNTTTYYPHEIQLDLGETYDVTGIRYLPRQTSVVNGTIAQYEIYVSTSTSSWGSAVASETWANNSSEKEVIFTAKSGQYVRLVAISEVNGNAWASGAELNVLESNGGSTTSTVTIVDLESYFNSDGFSYDTDRSDGDYDTSGYTYSADLVNPAPSYESVDYEIGAFTAGVDNVINCSGQEIIFTQDTYSSLRLLGSATNGDNTGTIRITYSDSTYTDISLTMADWCTGSSGQKIVQTMAHRHSSTSDSSQTNYIFAYYLTPVSGKLVSSIILPNNSDMHILALSLIK